MPKLHTPLPTEVFERREDFVVPGDAVYIFGQSGEERSHFSEGWRPRRNCKFLQIGEMTEALKIEVLPAGTAVALRSATQLENCSNPLSTETFSSTSRGCRITSGPRYCKQH